MISLNAESQRLFFALWPEQGVRDALYRLAESVLRGGSGRAVVRDNLHVTLVFLGSVPTARRDCAERVAAAIRGERFILAVDQIGYWQRSRILWAGASRSPAALLALVGALNDGLAGCGFAPEQRPYHAHVTLGRNITRGPRTSLAITPLLWPVDQFCLVQSTTEPKGAHYRVVKVWAVT